MTRAEWDAMAPDARDAMVAEKVMGWEHPNDEWGVDDDFWYVGGDPESEESFVWKFAALFTHDIAAAWQVVAKMGDTFFHLAWFAEGCHEWRASFGLVADDAYADTAPEAICLAALIALGEIEP